MSDFGKILASVTVPTGGYTLTWDADIVTVPAGTYPTALHLGEALRAAVSTGGYASTASFTPTGIFSISIAAMTSVVWAETSAGLITALGFDGDESVVSNAVTASNPHPDGWYPGTISFGAANGVGIAADTDWIPVDVADGVVAGNGQQSLIGPSRSIWERSLTFQYITRAEMQHRTRGPIALASSRWRYRELYWYPDRDDGDCGDYGTQGDPEDVATADYWLVTVASEPQFPSHAQRPDLFTPIVRFNGEPD